MTEVRKEKKQGRIRVKSEALILECAQEEFILQGYKGATVQSIADRAGLPKANILYYFKNKDNLYQAVLEHTLDMWDKGIGDINPEDGPKVAIEKFIASKVSMSFLHPKASKIYAMEIIQGAPHLQEFAITYLKQWVKEKTDLFQSWISSGQMSADVDPYYLIFLIWSTTQHYADFETQILNAMDTDQYREDEQEQVTQFLTQFILRGCGLAS